MMVNPFDSGLSETYGQSNFVDELSGSQTSRVNAARSAFDSFSKYTQAKESAEARKKMMKAAEPSTFEKVLSGVGQVASIGANVAGIFCERRLKSGIQSLDDRAAWVAVRDVPHYAFEYRHRPGLTAYGPMVDEVERIDPSLVVSMDAEARALGIDDGAPIRGINLARKQAYESLALQQALRRIEALESRLLQLEAALHPELQQSPRNQQIVPCWGGLDELPLVIGA